MFDDVLSASPKLLLRWMVLKPISLVMAMVPLTVGIPG